MSNDVAVEPSFALGFEFVPEELLPDLPVSTRGRRITPLIVLVCLGAAAMVGAGMVRSDPVVATGATSSATTLAPSSSASARSGAGADAHSTAVVASSSAHGVGGRAATALSSEGLERLQPTTAAARTPATGGRYVIPPVDPVRSTALVWNGRGDASSYDIELIRDGSRIFATSSPSPGVDVPRRWTHGGERFTVQPEDQVFVWPVVDGRRASRPVVNGTHVFDTTAIARFTG